MRVRLTKEQRIARVEDRMQRRMLRVADRARKDLSRIHGDDVLVKFDWRWFPPTGRHLPVEGYEWRLAADGSRRERPFVVKPALRPVPKKGEK